MALFLKPHTVRVYSVSEGADVMSKNTPLVDLDYTEARGQLTPMPAGMKARPEFLDLARPHLLLVNQSVTINYLDHVKYGDREFVVKAQPEEWDAETLTSCKAVVLEELDFELID